MDVHAAALGCNLQIKCQRLGQRRPPSGCRTAVGGERHPCVKFKRLLPMLLRQELLSAAAVRFGNAVSA